MKVFLIPFLVFLNFPFGHVSVHGQEIRLRDSALPTLRDSGAGDLPPKITGRLENFFQKLLRDPPETAFFELFSGTPFTDKSEIIANIVATSRKSVAEFGEFTGYEFSGTESFGERSLTVAYITTMPRKLLRWRFYFYSPGGTDWILANLKVDDMRNYLPRPGNREAPPANIQLEVEKFFVGLLSGTVRPSMKKLLAGSAVPDYLNSIENFVSLVEQSTMEYGAMKSYELYDRTQVGSRHVLLTYFAYLEQEPLRWQFLYRLQAPGQWQLANLRFDDMLDEAVLID